MFFFHLQTKKTSTNKILWEPINRFGRLNAQETFTKLKPLLPGNFKTCLVPEMKNVGERSTTKNICSVSLLFMVSKVFKKLLIIAALITLRNGDFLIVVSGGVARAFNRSWTTRAVALDIPKAFDRTWHAAPLCKLCLIEFQVGYVALFHLFSVIDGFKLFWMGSFCKNIQIMLEILKASHLVLHCNSLMIFQMMSMAFLKPNSL